MDISTVLAYVIGLLLTIAGYLVNDKLKTIGNALDRLDKRLSKGDEKFNDHGLMLSNHETRISILEERKK